MSIFDYVIAYQLFEKIEYLNNDYLGYSIDSQIIR